MRNAILPLWRHPSRALSFVFFIITFLFLYQYFASENSLFFFDSHSKGPSKEIVAVALRNDDTSWLQEYLPDWSAKVYVADDPKAKYTVPQNKGRESMAYLTYIIDHYNKLPNYVIFMHGPRYQWHNDDPIYDGVPVMRSLRLPHVSKLGFAPLRCTWFPGCPAEIKPSAPREAGNMDRQNTEKVYAEAFKELFPGVPLPETVGAPCSAQFAVTREQIWKRPKSDYKRIQNWLMKTELSDKISGRIMEYAWHIIMQMPPVYCPPANECYCHMFGLCDLNCTNARCENRYILPKYTHMPVGWPQFGGGQNGFPIPGWNER